MDTSTLFRVAPTFPMDDEHLRERRRILLMASPMTWGSLLGVSFLGVLAGFGVLGFVGLYAVTGLALRWYWDHHRSALDARALRNLVMESNNAQDVDLTRIIRRLGEKHFPQ